jgi:hypothetical protein
LTCLWTGPNIRPKYRPPRHEWPNYLALPNHQKTRTLGSTAHKSETGIVDVGSQVFAGQAVGIKEVQDDIGLVSFMDYDLGYFDLETRVLEPLENPFGPKVLPMS